MRRSIATLATLAVFGLGSSSTLAARASSPPILVSEYRFENPVQSDPSGCYTEDSVHTRTWSGTGTVAVGLDFCGPEDVVRNAGGAAFYVSVSGRYNSATITAPDGRQWQTIQHPSERTVVIRCFSGFPQGSNGGHALQGGVWSVVATGTRALFRVNVRAAQDMWASCVGVTVDPTIY